MSELLIHLINPNSTGAMTAQIERSARAASGPGVRVVAATNPTGPPAIETPHDELLAEPGVVRLVRTHHGASGHVIACFGDPGLAAARAAASTPVVGIAEAAMRSAAYLAPRFSVVTTLGSAVPGIIELSRRYGADAFCGGVHASGLAVLELESDPGSYDRVLTVARDALVLDGSGAIVLGCAGMAAWQQRLTADLGVPVVDGVAAAVGAVAGLVRAGAHVGVPQVTGWNASRYAAQSGRRAST